MSYINDALRKAQKDKQSPYAAYEPILSASGKKIGRPRRWLPIIGILIFVLWAAGIIALLYWPEGKKIQAAAPLKISSAPIAVPAALPVVKETPTENKKQNVLKTKTAAGEIKSKPERADSKTLYAQAVKKHQEGNLEEAKKLSKLIRET
jgi:hypothetical protein